jgi:hypothetical protein
MSASRMLGCTLLLLAAVPAGAHRLDEYLQATTLALEKGKVEAELRLVPGVAVFPTVFAQIDSDADGRASPAEERAYAQRVLDDLSLWIDDTALPLRLVSSAFSPKVLLQDGRGEIRIELEADVPGSATRHRLVFDNRHQPRVASYLVNVLVPADPDIRISAPERSYDQSSFRLDYTDAPASPASGSAAWGWPDLALAMLTLGLVISAWRVTVRTRRSHQDLRARPVGDQP